MSTDLTTWEELSDEDSTHYPKQYYSNGFYPGGSPIYTYEEEDYVEKDKQKIVNDMLYVPLPTQTFNLFDNHVPILDQLMCGKCNLQHGSDEPWIHCWRHNISFRLNRVNDIWHPDPVPSHYTEEIYSSDQKYNDDLDDYFRRLAPLSESNSSEPNHREKSPQYFKYTHNHKNYIKINE